MKFERFWFGKYRDASIYDHVCGRDDLKRLIFEHRTELIGLRVALVARRIGKVWGLCWGLLRDGQVVGAVILYFGRYRFESPTYTPAEPLDRSQLRTTRRYLLGCSICGGKDFWRCVPLRLCEAHKHVAVRRLRSWKEEFAIRGAACDAAAKEREQELKSRDKLRRLRVQGQHIGGVR